jgi:hypothetical protein
LNVTPRALHHYDGKQERGAVGHATKIIIIPFEDGSGEFQQD